MLYLHVISVCIQRLMDLVLKVKALMLLKEEVHTISESLVLLMYDSVQSSTALE